MYTVPMLSLLGALALRAAGASLPPVFDDTGAAASTSLVALGGNGGSDKIVQPNPCVERSLPP